MPPYTTLRDFISAVQTGRTNITRVLGELANSDEMKNDAAARADINRQWGFDTLPDWFRTACAQHGMSQDEITHIGAWPREQKDVVRAQIATAWSQPGATIHFSWEIYDGSDGHSEVRRDANSEVRVVFRSPRKGVHLDSFFRVGEVKVDV